MQYNAFKFSLEFKEMDFFRTLINCDDLASFVRDDIILNRDVLYFDWSGSGLESKAILNRMESILPLYANIHSNHSKNARNMMDLYLEAKRNLKKHLELEDSFYIIPSGYGATSAMKRYQEIHGFYIPPKLKKLLSLNNLDSNIVLIGPYEHHSNEISLREGICKSIRIKLNENGLIDLDFLNLVLEENKNKNLYASMNIVSNSTGIIIPYELISKKLRKYEVNIAFDLAASSSHMNVNSNLFDNAFLSPHKLLGGIGGCGILCIRKELLNLELAPTFSGGGNIKYASKENQYYIDDVESREDYGTPPILQLLKATLAYQYRNEIGLEYIQNKEKVIYEILINELKQIEGCEIYGIDNDAPHLPIISFNVNGISPYDLTYELSYKYNIESRAGCNCNGPYGHDLLNKKAITNMNDLNSKPSWIRLSMHYSNSLKDVEYLIQSLKKVVKKLR